MTLPPIAVRLARTVALAVILAIGIFNLYQAVIGWTLSDASAYWQAALRLREGEELYVAAGSVDAPDVYRYAPWFAWATVPWTFLPVQVAGTLWSMVLLAASAVALWPLVQARAWILVALFGPILVGISAVGNVHPLLVAGLVHGVERRGGPLAIAAAASLKIFPILLALVYAGRREWTRLVLALLLAALLWAPALVYDLRGYTTDPGQAAFLFGIPVLYFVATGLAVGGTLALAATRWGWLAGSVTVVLSLPRFFVYDVTFLMVGAIPALQSGRRG
ncbi:MAG TPA: hypothetical protein VFH63_00100 [candidate division Zixibacteria bacterium]|nr:hypothetical protein [candidate division Zixibacteria bacterium]